MENISSDISCSSGIDRCCSDIEITTPEIYKEIMTGKYQETIIIPNDIPIRKKMMIMPNPKEESEEYSFLYITEM